MPLVKPAQIKRFLFFTCLIQVLFSSCFAQTEATPLKSRSFLKLVNKNLKEASAQYHFFSRQIPLDKFPKTLKQSGELETSPSYWWCSGFYPGTLLYLHEANADPVLKQKAIEKMEFLKKEQYNKGTHDLGFMMYCSFGNANRLEPNDAYKQILINSAKSLSTRFSPVTKSIRSWNPKKKDDYIVIIDNMMNLELLFYATEVTGDSSFYKIAVAHANSTLANHFRADYSSYHVVDYNPFTGNVDNKRTHQGAADNSAWARGQAWGLYGFTVMYRKTKDLKYLNLANNIAEYILNHPNLPADKIPYWDFNAPGIPKTYRDASAGALAASALIELAGYNSAEICNKYLSASETMLVSLSSPAYKAPVGENGGFILKHSVGSLPHKSEIDVPLTYADYYYVEALLRFKKLAAGEPIL